MMKKLFSLLAVALFLPLQACAVEQWQEGTHYEVINDQATEEKQVLEFFSFWCPHCYNFEPLVEQVKSQLDEDVKFNKVHVNFMGFADKETQDAATRAMMVGRALKQSDKLNKAVFEYIHKQRSPLTNMDDLKNIFAINGVEKAEFDKLVKSFGVNSLFSKNNKLIAQYRQNVRGVPTFIVNGKFRPTFTRDMTPDDMIDLIVWLSQQK